MEVSIFAAISDATTEPKRFVLLTPPPPKGGTLERDETKAQCNDPVLSLNLRRLLFH